MLPSHRPLPLPYHLFDLAGQQAERVGFALGDLRLKTLIKDAQQQTGLVDFGHRYFQVGLKELLRSLEQDAHLRFYGRLVMRCMLTNYLSQRLLFVEALKHNPDAFSPLKERPIVVTGLHRSGTTFLHRLLALDPANAGIPYWRLYRPFRAQGLLDLRKIKAWTELGILRPIFPGIKNKHCIQPFAPEESCWMLGQTFQSMVFWIMAPVNSYLEWLWDQDFREVYREYALLLQKQQSVFPGRRLILKAPDHMPHLDLLLDAIPGASIVQLHRDPADCVLSLSSLFYSTHIALSDAVNVRRLAQANRDMLLGFIKANQHARRDPTVDRLVLDLHFEDLVADPISAVRNIYAHFGLAFSEEFGLRLGRLIARKKRQGRTGHNYSAEQFGLDKANLRGFFNLA